jgi:energy-coupling factor transport system substrate-specific component
MMKTPIVSRRILAAAVIGAALVFVFMRYVSVPSGIPSTNLNIAAVIVTITAAIFGPLAGFIAAFAGHALTDFFSGNGVWWTWVAADGIYGLLAGGFHHLYKIETGNFGVREALVFNLIQIVSNLLAWLALAPTLDILFYQEAANKVYLQGFVAALLNSIVILILGTIIISCYSRIISTGSDADDS